MYMCLLAKMGSNTEAEELHSLTVCSSLEVLMAVNSFPPSAAYMSVNRVSIGSDNGLSPFRRQATIWTNAGLSLFGPLGTNFSEILIKI